VNLLEFGAENVVVEWICMCLERKSVSGVNLYVFGAKKVAVKQICLSLERKMLLWSEFV